MREFEINTVRRAAYFLAQICYESGQLRWWEEFGGPGTWYAPYYGRGPIMLTHRDNYAQIGRMIGQPLVDRPGIIGAGGSPTGAPTDPRQGFRAAAAFWKSRDLNEIADQGDAGFNTIMARVLGTSNHPSRSERFAIYARAKNNLPKTLGGGGDMSFQEVTLAYATHDDGVLAHGAAAVLHGHDIRCTAADASNVKAAIAACQSKPVGTCDFVVVGKAAMKMFPDNLARFIGKPVRDSDYRDAVGEDLADTIDKLARVLDGIASRENVDAQLGEEFRSGLQETGRARRGGKESEGRGRTRRTGIEDNDADSGSKDLGGDPGRIRSAGLTERDFEEIGKEALEFFSVVNSLAGRGESPRHNREEY